MKKSCKNCVFFWRDGDGYSDYTWMETFMRCAANQHPTLPVDGDDLENPILDYAEQCKKFEESGDLVPLLISPEGDIDEGDAKQLVRILRHLI